MYPSVVAVPHGTTEIKRMTYYSATEIKRVVLPKSLRTIGTGAFLGCENLNEIEFPNGLKSIESQAFEDCKSLESVIIPSSVTNLGYQAFCACDSLSYVVIPNGISFLDDVFCRCISLSSISIPNSVTKIEGTFRNCSALRYVSLPDGLKEIGESTFYQCISLDSITLPKALKKIGSSAFSGSSLSYIDIPHGVETIGDYAFLSCKLLTYAKLPASITYIGVGAFDGACKTIEFKGTKEQWDAIKKHPDWIPGYCKYDLIFNPPKEPVDVASNTHAIHSSVCSTKEANNNETSQGASAAASRDYSCDKPTDQTTMPKKPKLFVDGYAYINDAYAAITIPNVENATIKSEIDGIPVVAIGDAYCLDESEVKNITIPSSIIEIVDEAFAGCKNLESIVYEGTKSQWRAIDKDVKWDVGMPECKIKCSDGVIFHKARKFSQKILSFLTIFPYTGLLGIHEYYLGNIGIGILKTFTANFFAFGWFYDIYKLFKK